MAPFTPGVPPGGEASWAIGGQPKRTEQKQRRKGVRCGISRVVSVCVEKRHADSLRFFSPFLLSAPPDGNANCTYALKPICANCALCAVHRHPTTRAVELLDEGDNATNKMDTVHRDQHVALLAGALCSLGLQP